MRYYLYTHTRLDTNEVFYVGTGTKATSGRIKGHKTEFSRAYEKAKRSIFWKNVASKTEIRVDILFQSDDLQLIYQKEIQYIKLYGRKCCDPDGVLVNFDEGGKNSTGPKKRALRISQFDLSGKLIKVWDFLDDLTKKTGYLKTNIVKCCRRKQLTAYGFKWSYTDNSQFDNIYPTAARKKRTNRQIGIQVTNRKTGEVNVYRTAEEVRQTFNVDRTTVLNYLHGKTKHKTHDFKYQSW